MPNSSQESLVSYRLFYLRQLLPEFGPHSLPEFVLSDQKTISVNSERYLAIFMCSSFHQKAILIDALSSHWDSKGFIVQLLSHICFISNSCSGKVPQILLTALFCSHQAWFTDILTMSVTNTYICQHIRYTEVISEKVAKQGRLPLPLFMTGKVSYTLIVW